LNGRSRPRRALDGRRPLPQAGRKRKLSRFRLLWSTHPTVAPFAVDAMPYSPNSTRTAVSTLASVAAVSMPQGALPRRSLLTVLTWSHRIKLGLFNPTSGGSTRRWAGIFFDLATLEVSGRTTTSPAGPALKASSLTTSTGRCPACSCPRPLPKSASHISPRIGSAMDYLSCCHAADACPPFQRPAVAMLLVAAADCTSLGHLVGGRIDTCGG